MYTSTLLAILLATGSKLVSGHGTVSKITVGGKTYPGSVGLGSDPSNSPVRAVESGDPIDDVTSDMMTCGRNAKAAPVSLEAKAGDTMQVFWQAESGGGPWFHNVGPVISYMTKCPGDCKDFTPSSSTQWFKVSALGLIDGSDKWYQAKMNDGSALPVTIPSGLSSGNYMLRHEILALQNAKSPHLAEFYPNCIQMKVTGGPNANANVQVNPTASFPGAYKFSDPGIEVDVYTPPLNYVMPGPAVANIAKSSGGGDSNPSSASAPANAAPSPTDASSSAPAAPTSSSTSSGNSTGTSQCRLRSSKTKRSQKRALKAHAKRRVMEAAY